ncbi:hypothetical protein ACIQUD_14880 [Streptomyces globisporus]|uniref:hypothetical protein n=1 Tax=Streptomyces globisporus TaxID=1908 RepID=UPI00380899D2
MARLQILELPEGASDDRPPFILVIDQVAFGNPVYERFVADEELATGLAKRVGAQAVLVFEDTIDIPANDTSAYAQPNTALHLDGHEVRGDVSAAGGETIRIRVEPDLEGFTEKVWTEAAKLQADVIDAVRQARP